MARAQPPVDLTPDLWMLKLILGAIDPSYDTKDEKSNMAPGAGMSRPPPQQGYGGPPGGAGYGQSQPGGYGQAPPPGQQGYGQRPPPPQGRAGIRHHSSSRGGSMDSVRRNRGRVGTRRRSRAGVGTVVGSRARRGIRSILRILRGGSRCDDGWLVGGYVGRCWHGLVQQSCVTGCLTLGRMSDPPSMTC